MSKFNSSIISTKNILWNSRNSLNNGEVFILSRNIEMQLIFQKTTLPLLISMGLAPLLIFSNPSFAILLARIVAAVVPSPASSLVLFATSWTSLAPTFCHLSLSSTALATVTPSLVILGLPQLCSIITLRPYNKTIPYKLHLKPNLGINLYWHIF